MARVLSADDCRCVQSIRVLLLDPPLQRVRVRPWFDRTFWTYGLPRALWTDNGPPFATMGAGQLSALGVPVVEARHPGGSHCPGASGAQWSPRAVSSTLQQETATPPAPTPQRQQARLMACDASLMPCVRMRRSARLRRRASIGLTPSLSRAARGAVL